MLITVRVEKFPRSLELHMSSWNLLRTHEPIISQLRAKTCKKDQIQQTVTINNKLQGTYSNNIAQNIYPLVHNINSIMNRQMAKANTTSDPSPSNTNGQILKQYGSNIYYPQEPNNTTGDCMKSNQTYRRATNIVAQQNDSHRDQNGSSIKQPSQSSYQPIVKQQSKSQNPFPQQSTYLKQQNQMIQQAQQQFKPHGHGGQIVPQGQLQSGKPWNLPIANNPVPNAPVPSQYQSTTVNIPARQLQQNIAANQHIQLLDVDQLIKQMKDRQQMQIQHQAQFNSFQVNNKAANPPPTMQQSLKQNGPQTLPKGQPMNYKTNQNFMKQYSGRQMGQIGNVVGQTGTQLNTQNNYYNNPLKPQNKPNQIASNPHSNEKFDIIVDETQSERKSRNDLQKYTAQIISNKEKEGGGPNPTTQSTNSPIVGYLIKNNILIDDKIDPSQINHRPQHSLNQYLASQQERQQMVHQMQMNVTTDGQLVLRSPPRAGQNMVGDDGQLLPGKLNCSYLLNQQQQVQQMVKNEQSNNNSPNTRNQGDEHSTAEQQQLFQLRLSKTPKLIGQALVNDNSLAKELSEIQHAESHQTQIGVGMMNGVMNHIVQHNSEILGTKDGYQDSGVYSSNHKNKTDLFQKIEINQNEKTIYLKKLNENLNNLQVQQKYDLNKPSMNNLINSGTEIVNSNGRNKIFKVQHHQGSKKELGSSDMQYRNKSQHQTQRKTASTIFGDKMNTKDSKHKGLDHRGIFEHNKDRLVDLKYVNSNEYSQQIVSKLENNLSRVSSSTGKRNDSTKNVHRSQSSDNNGKKRKKQIIQPLGNLSTKTGNLLETFDNSSSQQNQTASDAQRQQILINHGNININININDGNKESFTEQLKELKNMNKQELGSWIYHNVKKQQSDVGIGENSISGLQTPIQGKKSRSRMQTKNSPQKMDYKDKDEGMVQLIKFEKSSNKYDVKFKHQNAHEIIGNQKRVKHQQNQALSQGRPSKSQVNSTGMNTLHPNPNVPMKMNQSVSRQQLKKQVVQYYWQHLIQSYGNDKSKLKLDVKGKTINNGHPSAQSMNGFRMDFKPFIYGEKAQIIKEQELQKELQAYYLANNANLPLEQLQQLQMQQEEINNNQVQQCNCAKQITSGVFPPDVNKSSNINELIHHHSSSCPYGQNKGDEAIQMLTQEDYILQQRKYGQIQELLQNQRFRIQKQESNGSQFNQSHPSSIWQSQYNHSMSSQPDQQQSTQEPRQFNSPYHYMHLFDQFGHHSPLCKCYKSKDWPAQASQVQQQQQQKSAQLYDPHQRLNYIQQVCMQERTAAQQFQANLDEIRNAQGKGQGQPSSEKKALAQKPKPKPVPLTRLELINQFIAQLNTLISITLKATDSINPISLNHIKNLGKELGIKWTNHLDAKFIKSKDFVIFLKSRIYVLLNNLLVKNKDTLQSQVQLILQQNMLNNKQLALKLMKEIGQVEKQQQAAASASASDAATASQSCGQSQQLLELSKRHMHLNYQKTILMNDQFINQIFQFNQIKLKNFGFKFWVEYPTAWGNNFIVVKNVTKRRTWLQWVNFDPYEERSEQDQAQNFFSLVTPCLSPQKDLDNLEKNNKQELILSSKKTDGKVGKESPDKKEDKEKSSKRKKKQQPVEIESEVEEPDPFEVTKNHLPIWPNLIFTQVRRVKIVKELLPHQIYNHIDGINQIAAKCQLHRNMKEYAYTESQECPWDIMPETYIVDLDGDRKNNNILEHEEFQEFLKVYEKGSWWIIKPGEDANRGHGIRVLDKLSEIKNCIIQELNGGTKQYKTCIIQRYMKNPLLIYRRKFDIRVFALLSYVSSFERLQGTLRGWFYEEGYIRTSCKEFSLSAGDNAFVHLTNDAVQKQSQDYGKYEAGNKMSYSDFDKFLIKEKNVSFISRVLPMIRNRVADTFKAAGHKLIGEIRSDYNGFEWLGFDFMLDDDLNLKLIEVNTNPCLETQSCILLQRLIPQMIDQSMKIAVDPFFGANENQYHTNQEFVATEIKYSLVYETMIDNIKNSPSEHAQIDDKMQQALINEENQQLVELENYKDLETDKDNESMEATVE